MTEPIVITRSIAAPPATVYAYLTESDRWRRWQGVKATIESRPGGLFSISMANGSNARGQFVELVPDQKVVFSWGWLDNPALPPGSTIVEIELQAVEGGTLLRLTHRDLPAEAIDLHTAGWNRYLPRLAMAAEGGNPGPDF